MTAKRKTVGLDTGAWAVKVVELEGSAMKPILRNLGLVKLTPGVIEDGEWKQTEEILKGLAGLWWLERLSRERVVAGLTGPHIYIRRIAFEKMDEALLRKRVAEEVKFYLPVDPENTALDFQIVGQGPEYLDLLVVTVPYKLIQQYLRLLTALGLKPSALEVPAIGLFNLWEFNYPDEQDCFLVHIGYELTRLIYIEARKPRSMRVLLLGTKHCLARIQKQLGLDYTAAEKILEGGRASEEGSTIISDFAQELIQKLETDKKFLPPGYAVPRCYLSGGGSLVPKLVEHLSPQLNCELLEPFRRIEIPEGLMNNPLLKIAPVFAVAAGLALRGLHD